MEKYAALTNMKTVYVDDKPHLVEASVDEIKAEIELQIGEKFPKYTILSWHVAEMKLLFHKVVQCRFEVPDDE